MDLQEPAFGKRIRPGARELISETYHKHWNMQHMYHDRADVSFSSWSSARRRNRREGRDVYVEPRTVDVHIRRLRKAINNDKENDLIRTVRAAGYALDYAS